jgi:hypothetical protein
LLAPLTAHLTHLAFSGVRCGDPELIAVCSLTAITRLEMIHDVENWTAPEFSAEGPNVQKRDYFDFDFDLI